MKTPLATKEADTVLQLLRALPLKDRLRVVAAVLPELENDLLDVPASPEFWRCPDIETLAELQGVTPSTDFGAFLGGWPADESVDDFLMAIEDWRQSHLGGAQDSAVSSC
jgi:hypothetical protein